MHIWVFLLNIRKSNWRFRKCLEDTGSASVEFVLLAIPLFLPILLFLNQFSQLSNAELVGRNLVREALRAYVTTSRYLDASSRAQQALYTAAGVEGLSDSEINSLQLNFQCSLNPCLSPNGLIRATLKMKVDGQNREVISEAQETVSPWQNTGYGYGLQWYKEIDEFGFDSKWDYLGNPIEVQGKKIDWRIWRLPPISKKPTL